MNVPTMAQASTEPGIASHSRESQFTTMCDARSNTGCMRKFRRWLTHLKKNINAMTAIGAPKARIYLVLRGLLTRSISFGTI